VNYLAKKNFDMYSVL